MFCVVLRDEHNRITPLENLEALDVEQDLQELAALIGAPSTDAKDLSCNDYRYFNKQHEAENFIEHFKQSWKVFNSIKIPMPSSLPVVFFPRHNLIEISGRSKTSTTRDHLSKAILNLQIGDKFYASDRTYKILLTLKGITKMSSGYRVDFELI